VVLKKCREQDDNIVFIDASGSDHYIKVGNQNELREYDVELIVETYRKRETQDKYSYVATLAEIAENDYNLNIPRYVDTFEEEESINLDEVAAELVELDSELKSNEVSLIGFCKELGIKTPF
jgi:type I restriction enzyme M protein